MNDHTEIRIHGIGLHGPLSALGTPRLVAGDDRGVSIYEAPDNAEHRLLLLNWSVATRRRYRVGWWLVLPLSLVNVASYMSPGRDRPADRRYRALVGTVATAVTIAYVLWAFAIAETVFRPWAHGTPGWLLVRIVAFALTLVLLLTMARSLRDRAPRTAGPVGETLSVPRAGWWFQFALVIGTSGMLLLLRPARIRIPPDAPALLRRVVSTCWTVSGPCPDRLDLVGGFALASTVLVGLVTLATIVVPQLRPFARGAAVMTVGVVLVHAVAGSIRNAADWLSAYFSEMRLIPAAPCRGSCLEAIDASRMVLPLALRSARPAYDLVTLGLVQLVLLAAMTLPAQRLVKRADAMERAERRRDRLHAVMARPPFLASVALLPVLTMGIAFLFASSRGGLFTWVVILPLHLSALLVPLLMLAVAGLRPVREVVGSIADIVGYWPKRMSPLSGDAYTGSVCESMEATLRAAPDQHVLVGHSQGSIIAFTVAARNPDIRLRGLVTCGSPLAVLYQSAFPAWFTPDTALAVGESLEGRWKNFWRATDPIASRIVGANNCEIPERGDSTIRGHSDYWIEEEQRQGVRDLIARAGT